MEDITDRLIADGYLKTPSIIEAFRAVRREDFLPLSEKERAGLNLPLPIGYGQTNSQPLTVAFLLELLQPKPGEKVLDVGAGSGWTAALFAHIVGEKGSVRAVERIPQLCAFAQKNLDSYNLPQVSVECSDATVPHPEQPGYDLIHVAAAASEIPPAFRDQLAIRGRLVIPIGAGTQAVVLLTKTGKGRFLEQRFPGFSFVPLIQGPIA